MDRTWIIGKFLKRNDNSGMHRIGGTPTKDQAKCPNCQKPYITLLTLDFDDPVLPENWFGNKHLELIHCPRCDTFNEDFAYRMFPTGKIESVLEGDGPDKAWRRQWDLDFPLGYIEPYNCSLLPLSPKVQELLCKANSGLKLTRDEKNIISYQTGHYADEEVGGYPMLGVCNQVGGIPYLPQGFNPPMCPHCPVAGNAEEMVCLACLTNDNFQSIRIMYDEVYLIYWGCLTCGTILVEQYAN